jgi:hypothetical protein
MNFTGRSRAENVHHLRMLRNMGLVSQRFGRLRSKRVEKAYAIYFTKRLSIRTIGQKVSLTKFHSIIKQRRERGYDVSPSLYVYDGRERSRVLIGIRVATYFLSVSLIISRSRISAKGSGAESGEFNRHFLLLF